jgi:hypothetical protein
MPTRVAPALRALLENTIDYAGTFPPASLPLNTVLLQYAAYGASAEAWLLGRLVISDLDLPRVGPVLDEYLAVVSDWDVPRAAAVETRRLFAASRPTYCEVPIESLEMAKRAGCFAKIRTGGVTPEAIPSVADVAKFICACAELRLPFKATAGLHHPVRSLQPLTYETDAPRAVMHGFLNVFMAAAFAWHGEDDIEPILAETDPAAFSFSEEARWRDMSLMASRVREARDRFAHSFGSCSFVEPIHDLEALGLL